MARKTPRSPEELATLKAMKRTASLQYAAEWFKGVEYGAPELTQFENRFSSETAAGESRGGLMVGPHIGNGGKWARSFRYE